MTSTRLFPHDNAEGLLDPTSAEQELSTAWRVYQKSTIRHFNEGLAFGRVCYGWRSKYKAQGSRKGRGFDQLLEKLSIPKTTAYRWIHRYEVKNGLRSNRNEVAQSEDDQGSSVAVEKRISFHFCLNREQLRQFESDVKILGGRKEVADMFLRFLSQAASEKRSPGAPIEKAAAWPGTEYRRTA